MKNSFRVLIALCLCATIGASAFAAPQGGPAGGMGKMRGAKMGGMGRMAQELGLTDAQKAKIKAILQTQMPQMKALRENKTLTPEQKMTKMRALRMAQMKKMEAILTPAQRKKVAAMRAQQRGQRGGPM